MNKMLILWWKWGARGQNSDNDDEKIYKEAFATRTNISTPGRAANIIMLLVFLFSAGDKTCPCLDNDSFGMHSC